MAKRLLTTLSMIYSLDADATKKLLSNEYVLDESNDETNAANEMVARHFVLATNATDEAVALDKITRISTLLIVAEQEITVKLDGTGSPAIPVRPIPEVTSNPLSLYQKAAQPGILFLRGRVNSVHLGNPSSANTATVTVYMFGDAAA